MPPSALDSGGWTAAAAPRETSVLNLVYPLRRSEKQVLLGLKRRGFGEGKYNGFGGKLEEGENIEQGAARELQEESGLECHAEDLRWRGTLTYLYDTKPKAMEVHVYDVERWSGEAAETAEMTPCWFDYDSIPLAKMWADDEYWLQQYLRGELGTPFRGRFRFKGHEGADSWVVLEHSLTSNSTITTLDPGMPAASSSSSALVASTVSFEQLPSARPLESFIRYHLRKGFAHVLLVIDSNGDRAALDAVRRFPASQVTVKVRSPELRAEQERHCTAFADLAPLMEEDVSARQVLDAELAMALAPSVGCSWVVYLDADELFYTREESVRKHFEELARDGVDHMTYLNHEGVPEQEDTADYFSTITLFKRHHFAVPLTAAARQGLSFWMDRSAHGQFLLFYDNGKSACRTVAGARPRSQHSWSLPAGCRSCTALADIRNLNVEGYRRCEDPCILHFPVCGLSWMDGKYKTLGDFSEKWLGKVKVPDCFHLDAKTASAAQDGSLERLFREQVLLMDRAQLEEQIRHGVCMRITDHCQTLEAVVSVDTATHCLGAAGGCEGQPQESPAGPQAQSSTEALRGIERGWILSKTMAYLS